MIRLIVSTLILCMIGFNGFSQESEQKYVEELKERTDKIVTLYRGSVVSGISRIHVATFDAAEAYEYNWENCNIAAKLFQSQPSVVVQYWCEKGFFNK